MRAYLDTCIVSGLAKGDLGPDEAAALLRILEARKLGRVELVTSNIANGKISRIPEAHRTLHAVIYNLLADVKAAAPYRADSGLLLMGVGGADGKILYSQNSRKCFLTLVTPSTSFRLPKTMSISSSL
jgi:hypothetical protein